MPNATSPSRCAFLSASAMVAAAHRVERIIPATARGKSQ